MKKNYLVNLLISAAAILLTILAINTYLTFKIHRIMISETRWPIGSFRPDSTIGFAMTPAFSSLMNNGSFFIKSHKWGYRISKSEDMFSYKKDGILFVGCSFTYGDEVESDSTFSHLVQDSLKIPSYNFGVCSYSYASILLQLETMEKNAILDSLHPSVIVFGFGDWLVDRSLSPFYPTRELKLCYPYIRKKDTALVLERPPEFLFAAPFFELLPNYFSLTASTSELTIRRFVMLFPFAMKYYAGKIYRNYLFQPDKLDRSELYLFLFTRIKSIAQRHNMKVIILSMPIKYPPEYDTTLAKSLDRFQEFSHVYGASALTAEQVPKEAFFKTHPKPQAHRAYAHALISELIRFKMIKTNITTNSSAN
jgi:hypothetical protein